MPVFLCDKNACALLNLWVIKSSCANKMFYNLLWYYQDLQRLHEQNVISVDNNCEIKKFCELRQVCHVWILHIQINGLINLHFLTNSFIITTSVMFYLNLQNQNKWDMEKLMTKLCLPINCFYFPLLVFWCTLRLSMTD